MLGLLLWGAGSPAAVTLQYLGHSCFALTAPSGTRLLIDPYQSGEWPGLVFPQVRAHRVLVSHPHWDHDASEQVYGEAKVIRGPGAQDGDGCRIRGISGRHARTGGESIGYENTIFVIETGGIRFCHLGDNGPPEGDLAARVGSEGPIDVLMLPIDSESRVLDEEGARGWIEALKPRIVIPMHYRLPGLAPDRISGIGTIDGWLSRQEEVVRVEGDSLVLKADDLPPQGAASVRYFVLPGQREGGPAGPSPAAAEAKRSGLEAAAQGDILTAIERFNLAAELDPGDAEVLHRLGFLHLGSARPDRALEVFTRSATVAGEGDPRNASLAWLGIGMAEDLLGRRDRAMAAYEKVIAIGLNDENQVDQARGYLDSPYTDD